MPSAALASRGLRLLGEATTRQPVERLSTARGGRDAGGQRASRASSEGCRSLA
jgi:hypothetical protein